MKSLPSGSGLDYKWHVDKGGTTYNKLVLKSAYHAMNQNGMYDRWIEFTVTITASWETDYDLSVRGNFGEYQDIKDYLMDIIGMEVSSGLERTEG